MTQPNLFTTEPTCRVETKPVARKAFDLARGNAHKQSGMDAAAQYRQGLLVRAQAIARKLAADGRSIMIDDVIDALIVGSDNPAMLGNAAGSIFRGHEWTCCGFTPSRRVSNHARVVRMWRLKK